MFVFSSVLTFLSDIVDNPAAKLPPEMKEKASRVRDDISRCK